MSVLNSRIKKLDGKVVDQIAAGEVIERPSQLIKELIENSLDALSDRIELNVSSGLSQITITDNGEGILREDLPLVFERHSTSKITTAEELFDLHSFGFRGEALSAIGSVSKIHLESKSLNENQGHMLIWNQGEKETLVKSDIPEGTRLSVSHLFDSTPARKKFLKSQKYELTLVKRVFNSFALFHYDKEFKFVVDQKLQSFFSKSSSREERYKQIFKEKAYKISVPETEFIDKGSFIYLEEPGIESKSHQSLWVYVQNRWVEDKAIHAAVRDGLNTYLMHGCQPRGVVDLKFKSDFVDVNVHPMKSQVRFQDSSHLYKNIRQAVSQWAALAPWSKEKETAPKEAFQFKEMKNYPESFSSLQKPASFSKTEGQQQGSENRSYDREKDQSKGSFFSGSRVTRALSEKSVQAQMPFELKEQQIQYKKTYGDLNLTNKIERLVKEEDGFEPVWSNLMVIGQVNLTYLVCQSQEAVYFIDQHAAHERVGYEKLVRSWKNNQNSGVQNLLLPLHIDLEENDVQALMNIRKELEAVGITIDQGGPQVVVLNSHPGFLKEEAIEKALRDLSQKLIKFGGGASLDEVFELFFATVSCHSVIRAGHSMSDEEVKLLLLEMDKYRSNFCPHGRPVYKKITFKSLDKDFGRTL